MTAPARGGALPEHAFRRRSLLGGALLLPLAAVLGCRSGTESTRPEGRGSTATVDLGRPVSTTTPYAMGVGVSTYGATALGSRAQREAERRLDARYVRLPVGWRDGRVTSSATGGPTDLDVPALTDLYRSWGYRVLAVIGGRTTDIDVQPGDAERIIAALGDDMIEYSSPNEPDNTEGGSLAAAIDVAAIIHAEGSRLVPDMTVWGPVWTTYDRVALRTFAAAMGESRLAGIDYHHYAMGSESLPTRAALGRTPVWGDEVREVRADLRTLGLPERVNVDEYNLSWRSNDGTPEADGGFVSPASGELVNGRFFTAVNTVFIASVAGHVMRAGGAAMPYATQNRALGVMVQNEYDGNTAHHPDSGGVQQPDSSPMPAFWGIAAWTGAKIWPHMADEFFDVAGPGDPAVEVFAVSNEAGGHNVVLINKSETQQTSLELVVRGTPDRAFDLFQSDPAAPFEAPQRIRSERTAEGRVSLRLPPLTVSVLALRPA
ncbi:hypothetical protein [Blastococcus sp. SYSU DS0617]